MKLNSQRTHKKSLLARVRDINYNVIDELAVGIMFIVSIVFIIFLMSSCTMSVNMMNSQGKAEDVVDTDQKADADISPTLSIPLTP